MRVPQFYVRSNVHMTNLDSAINRLLVNESLIDVTLACDGHRFQCHRLVLAAASPLFEELLMEHPKEHPIVIIPIGVKWHILKSLIEFMYRGQTYINQIELKTLIESAELLQVIGLYDPQTQFREVFNVDNGDECTNVDQQDYSPTSINDEREEEEEIQIQISESNQDQENTEDHQQDEYEEIIDKKNENEDMHEKKNDVDKPIQKIVDYIEIDDSQDEIVVLTTGDEVSSPPTKDQMTMTNEDNFEETFKNNFVPISIESNSETNVDDATEIEEKKRIENDILQNVPHMTITKKTVTLPATIEAIPTIRVKPTIKLINLFKLNRPVQTNVNQISPNVPWTYIHIPATPGSNSRSPSLQVPLNTNIATMSLPINTLPQLMPVTTVNAKTVQENNESKVECLSVVPSFLKFNSSSMAISVKNLDRTKTHEKLNDLNVALESEAPKQLQFCMDESSIGDEDEPKTQQDGGENYHYQQDLNPEVHHGIKQELKVKMELIDFVNDREKKIVEAESEVENIICQPNVSYIYDSHEYGKDVVKNIDDNGCIDYDRFFVETCDNMQHNSHKPNNKTNTKIKKSSKAQLSPTETSAAAGNSNNIPSTYILKASEVTNNHHHLHQRFKGPPNLVPLSADNAELGPMHLYYHQNKNNTDKNMSDLPDSHTQSSVILRNPRCNQPRHYSNESLYSALMAVKYGESIYRASRLHQVPRKTLRNWMKRWDIKSQYPMPKQLKDAAKKKKITQTQSA